MSTQTWLYGGLWPFAAPSRALVLNTPFLIRFFISPALFWNTENTGQKLDAKSFQGEISTFLAQGKLVSIYRTNTLSKNKDWRLAGLQCLLLWWLLILCCCSDVVHHFIQQTSTELILSHTLSARCCGFKAH